MFISFEGVDFSGKSTQIDLLYKSLHFENCILTKEPGGGGIGDFVREYIKSSNEKHSMVELLLLMAARQDHIANIIEPNIRKNKIVLVDRYHESTIVYQGIYKKCPINIINSISEGFIMPYVTYIFYIPYENLKLRFKYREFDAIESQDNFFYNVNRYYLMLSKLYELGGCSVELLSNDIDNFKRRLECHDNFEKNNMSHIKVDKNRRFFIVDASLSIEIIHEMILSSVLKLLDKR